MQSPPFGHGRRRGLQYPMRLVVVLVSFALAAGGCGFGDEDRATSVEALVTERSFESGLDDCSETFTGHDLEHVTQGRGQVTAMTDGTGAGVLLEDLDDDGLVDIVLPNLSGETSILWNEGGLQFERRSLIKGRFRQALSADVNADGDRDLLLTTGGGPPITLASDGKNADGSASRTFTRQEFRTPAVTYSIAVGDLAGDGTLQVATGSYNAELTQNRDLRALTGNGVGAALHTFTDGVIETEFLTPQAQALVTLIVDLDNDGVQDVIMGNDLGTPDKIWLGDGTGGSTGLIESLPFDTTTLSTMSIDVVDFDNDGDADVIATDMAPMADEAREPWLAVMPDIQAAMVDDVQEPRNKLQLWTDDRYEDQAADLGVDATGWSWSGIAGDLDNDGLLDLYVVNGMQATSIFPDLADGLLVEQNQAFRNANGALSPAPEWGLADTAGGRGMAQADMDNDGDLDVVINNLGEPSKLFENNLCGGASIIVDPIWAGVQNRDGLGSSVTVDAGDVTYTRQITSNRGYLSSPPTEAHIGLGAQSDPVDVTVTWPDGAVTTLANVDPGQHLTVTRVDEVDS